MLKIKCSPNFTENPDNDELAELDVAQVDGAEGELEPDLEAPVLIPRRRSINLQVDALGEEIPSLGVRNVRAIAPGVYALELAQMWQPPAAFGDVEGGWSNRNAPPNRPADGVYLFTVRADMPCRTVSCLATAKLEELPLEVQTFQGSAALMV